jgi:hypothetical protein
MVHPTYGVLAVWRPALMVLLPAICLQLLPAVVQLLLELVHICL